MCRGVGCSSQSKLEEMPVWPKGIDQCANQDQCGRQDAPPTCATLWPLHIHRPANAQLVLSNTRGGLNSPKAHRQSFQRARPPGLALSGNFYFCPTPTLHRETIEMPRSWNLGKFQLSFGQIALDATYFPFWINLKMTN